MTSRTRRSISRFTLIELLVSLGVLSIMMLLLFRYIITTQRTWDVSEGLQEMVDKKRVALDLLERDLNAAITSSVLDQQIGFYVPDPATDDFVLCFVSRSTLNEGAPSRLCEIYYKVEDYSLKRLMINATDSRWNFFNDTSLTDPPWADRMAGGYETVIDGGVAVFNVNFFANSLDANPIPPGTVVYELPERAQVDLVLFDPNLPVMTRDAIDRASHVFPLSLNLNKLIPE